MSKISKLNVLRKVTAGVLAGTLATSAAACGKKDIEKEEKQGTSITIEEDTTKKKSNIETTVENMIEGKTTGENNDNSNTGYDYSDPGYEYTEYADPTEEYTEGQTEVKTEGKTEAKTEAKTEGKTEGTKVQSPFEHRVGNASPEKHTDPTTQKPSQHTTVKTTTVKNTGVKITTTTKKVTTAKPTTKKVTTTTTKPVTTAKPTTQKPTEPPTTQPPAPVHEYVLENIAHDSSVFEYYARELKGELYQFRTYNSQYGSTAAGSETELLLAILNYGQIDERVLQETLGGYSAENMVDYGNFLYNIAQMKKDYGANVDFTKYTLNRTIGEYMNSLSNAADNGNLTDMIRNAWENDDMPEDCLNHPAPYIALASYDEVYDNEQILNAFDANTYIVSEKVDEIISKCLGRSYTR